MKSQDYTIKVGDIVSVDFSNDEESLSNCEILRIPQGPGDFYQVLHKGPKFWYVRVLNTFETITKSFPAPLEVVNHVQESKKSGNDICQRCWQTPCTC